jgi:hypothetical protein
MITPTDCEAVDYIVYGIPDACTAENSVAAQFGTHLRGSTAGRAATFDRAVFLVGMLLAVMTYGRSHTRLIHQILTQEVPRDWQEKWGIRQQRTRNGQSVTWVLSEDDLQNVAKRITDRFDNGPKRLTEETWTGRGDVEYERQRRRKALNDLIDSLLIRTCPPRPRGAANYAIDGSGIWANERAPKALPKKEIVEQDEDLVDAIIRDPHDGEGEEKALAAPAQPRQKKGGPSDAGYSAKTRKDGKREWFFGYELHALVRVPDRVPAGNPRSEPALAERIRLTRAGADVVEPSLEIIDSIRATGQRVKYLLADRHYPYKKYDRWLRQLLLRGIRQVVDLRSDDHGFEDWGDKTKVVAGWPHCPGTPVDLGEISAPDVATATPQDWERFHDRIEERHPYAARRTMPLKPNGMSRWQCPARAGTVGCTHVAGSAEKAIEKKQPVVASPPPLDESPALCRQDTVGLPITTPQQASAMKVHQHHYWGTREHRALMSLRTFVEGWFGILKGDSSASKRRGSSLYVGLPLATLEIATFAVTSNLIALRAWHRETGKGPADHPLYRDRRSNLHVVHLGEADYQDWLAHRRKGAA